MRPPSGFPSIPSGLMLQSCKDNPQSDRTQGLLENGQDSICSFGHAGPRVEGTQMGSPT